MEIKRVVSRKDIPNSVLTEDDRRANYMSTMGSDLGCFFHDLQEEVDWLQQKWRGFHELFGKGSERIELLNAAASNFFFLLHRLMFEDAMLQLCRLTDPAVTRIRIGGKTVVRQNLTIMGLAAKISDSTLRALIEKQVPEVKGDCKFARELRNHRLAHTDVESLRNPGLGPKIVAKNIDDALRSLRGLLRLVDNFYGHPPSAMVADPWGARSLIYHLENAMKLDRFTD
jgi:hypothetical protein